MILLSGALNTSTMMSARYHLPLSIVDQRPQIVLYSMRTALDHVRQVSLGEVSSPL
jgi:hypothetical protein